MFAAYPKASRPIAALPRKQGVVQSFAVLSATGIGALAVVGVSIASSATAMAGIGAFSPVIVGQASAVFNASGIGTQSFTLQGNAHAVLSTSGLGNFNAPSIVSAFSSLTAAGLGGFSATITAPTFSSMSAMGSGGFAINIVALSFSEASFAGESVFGASDNPASEAFFEGIGSFAAVSYAFYADAERACLHQEITTAGIAFEDRVFRTPYEDRGTLEPDAVVPPEDRIAIVPAEYRVYHVAADRPGAGSQPRKRVC